MQECHHPLIYLDNLKTIMLEWKNVVLDIFDIYYLMQPHMFAYEIQLSKHILPQKRAEGKHYYVAMSHATKKLVMVIYQLEHSG